MNIEHLAAQKAPETLKNFIAGRWVASSSNETLVVPNPATEQILAHVPLSNTADVAAAVAGARAAAFEWGEMPPPERATYLFKLREALLDNREALTKLDILDGFSEIKVCTGYRLDGDRLHRDLPRLGAVRNKSTGSAFDIEEFLHPNICAKACLSYDIAIATYKLQRDVISNYAGFP